MKQNIRSNYILCIAILIIMVLMSNIINFAMSIMQSATSKVDVSTYQEEFYTYLGSLATYDQMTQGELSYHDFIAKADTSEYDIAFSMLNKQAGTTLSVEGFEEAITGLKQSNISIDTYVKQFEYSYALAQTKGVFDQEELTMSEMLSTTLEIMGVSPDVVKRMGEMDTTAMLNQMYYTVIGLLPIFILVVILANSLIAELVDRGSMAYVLSTPTKRSAVAITQAVFMIIVPFVIISVVCMTRIATSFLFFDEVNVPGILALFAGMYVLVEAVCGICYLGSCLFSQSKKAIGFGGGIATWFFLASLLGMFGSENMVSTGMGIEELSIFNKLTLIGLYDIDSLATVGTGSVDTAFVWKICVLVAVAVICYIAGAARFVKKDLPL
ncbi:MAG: ABC transporter permease [Lachnospiraceae bacterium]|nr:ABC transporter permease [Lachnospiraceae bacterium]